MDWEGSLLSQMSAIRGLGWLRRRLPQTGTAPGAVRDLAMRDGTEQNRARDARPGAARTRRPHCTAARGGSTSRHPNPLPAAACERSNNGAAQFAPRRACNRVLRAVCGDRQAVRSPPLPKAVSSAHSCHPLTLVHGRGAVASGQWPRCQAALHSACGCGHQHAPATGPPTSTNTRPIMASTGRQLHCAPLRGPDHREGVALGRSARGWRERPRGAQT